MSELGVRIRDLNSDFLEVFQRLVKARQGMLPADAEDGEDLDLIRLRALRQGVWGRLPVLSRDPGYKKGAVAEEVVGVSLIGRYILHGVIAARLRDAVLTGEDALSHGYHIEGNGVFLSGTHALSYTKKISIIDSILYGDHILEAAQDVVIQDSIVAGWDPFRFAEGYLLNSHLVDDRGRIRYIEQALFRDLKIP